MHVALKRLFRRLRHEGNVVRRLLSRTRPMYYAELSRFGGLTQALQLLLSENDSDFSVRTADERGDVYSCAEVAWNRRWVRVTVDGEYRFGFRCFHDLEPLADGCDADLRDVARVIDVWLAWQCTTAELVAQFPNVTPERRAEAFERGDLVRYQWELYLSGDLRQRTPELFEFIEAAWQHKELRQLYPLYHAWMFSFSCCTGFPYTCDLPSVQAVGDRFAVLGPKGQALAVLDSAEEAADVVVQHLPANCGPAFSGTYGIEGQLDHELHTGSDAR